MSRLACLVLAVVPFATLAADKKAENDLRFGLGYCKKVLDVLERAKAEGSSPDRIAAMVAKVGDDHAKYKDYVTKATAADATVTASTTVYDKKANLTLAQGFERCQGIDAQLAALQGKAADGKAAQTAAKEKASADDAAARLVEGAMDSARTAIGICTIFKKWASSSGMGDQLARYQEQKKAALDTLAAVVKEKHTATSVEAPGVEATKTVGEWFALCDKMMPEQLAAMQAKDKAAADAAEADARKRRALDDRTRAANEAKYNALVAGCGGDRQRILKSKGFIPDSPRNGAFQGAPVWRWEINITNEATRCETYQFNGDALAKTSTSLGGCP